MDRPGQQHDPIDMMTLDDLRLLAKAQRTAMQAMCPHMHGHDPRRTHAVSLWESALNAHHNAQKGDLGPVGIILAALEDVTREARSAVEAATLAKQRWEEATATTGLRMMPGALTMDEAALAMCEDLYLVHPLF